MLVKLLVCLWVFQICSWLWFSVDSFSAVWKQPCSCWQNNNDNKKNVGLSLEWNALSIFQNLPVDRAEKCKKCETNKPYVLLFMHLAKMWFLLPCFSSIENLFYKTWHSHVSPLSFPSSSLQLTLLFSPSFMIPLLSHLSSNTVTSSFMRFLKL